MLLWVVLGAGIELSACGDLQGNTRVLLDPLLAGHALVVRIVDPASGNDLEVSRDIERSASAYLARGVEFVAIAPTLENWDSSLLAGWRSAPPLSNLVLTRGEPASKLLFIDRAGQVLSDPTSLEAGLEALAASMPADQKPLLDQLLAGPWRDEREGWFIAFEPVDGGLRFRAEEMTRWDRPTATDIVAAGTVIVAPPLVRVDKQIFWFDPRAGNLLDFTDVSHRMVPAARPRLPVIDGAAIDQPEAIAKAMQDTDPLVRREAVYHSLRGMQRMELSVELAPWSRVDDDDTWTRATAIYAAGECGQADLVPKLEAMLESPHGIIRRECVRALGKLGWDAQHPRLQQLARQDIDPIVRALAANPPKPPPPPPDFDDDEGDVEVGGEPR